MAVESGATTTLQVVREGGRRGGDGAESKRRDAR